MDEHSPPSSRKSSAIGKVDLVDTPRMSPYRTRSRKNSALTEENIAMHNDSPTTRSATSTTRRVTRRMSQGSENAIVLTPMPQPAKRTTRRSPSVASGDDVCLTPKKKFSVAKENVVMEEDEAVEEGKLTTPNENGSANVDKENISVNGIVPEVTPQQKSVDANKINLVVQQSADSKIDSNVASVEPIVANTESPKPLVSTIGSSELPIESAMETSQNEPETKISISEPVSTIVGKTPDALLDSGEKSFSEMAELNVSLQTTTVELQNVVMTPSVTGPADKQQMDSSLNDTVFEVDSPSKSTGIFVSNVTVLPSTPIAQVTCMDVITIDDTPVQTRKSAMETPTKTARSTLNTSIDVTTSPKTTIPSTPVQTRQSSLADTTGPKTPLSIAKTSIAVTASPKTPLQIEASTTIIVPDTPIVPSTSAEDKTIPDPPSKIVPEVSQSNMIVTESEEEILLRTPPPPAKPSKLEPAASNEMKSGDSTTTSTNPPEITQLQNGVSDATDEYPKWGGSIRRKSDGQPIDKFGVKEATETATLTVKRSAKKLSIVSIRDSDDDCSDNDKSRNMFIDDEAMDSNGEASMDEDERQYMEENEIPVDGISLGSGSDSENGDSDGSESNDSFIVSDSSIPLLDGTGDDLDLSNELELNKSQSKLKRGNQICDTSDEEVEVATKARKSSTSKRRSDSSLNNPAKQSKLDGSRHNKIGDSDDEDELANLADAPRQTRSSKRLSESRPIAKKDDKRMSLHPNMKLSSVESNEEEPQSSVNQNHSTTVDDSSEEEVTQELMANMDDAPKKTLGSRRLSESLSSSKKDLKRLSLHPNTKLSSVVVENGSTVDSTKEELANLDDEPKKITKLKRLSEVKQLSKKERKRLSLHPNTKLSSLESNEVDQQHEPIIIDDIDDETVTEQLAHMNDEPQKTVNSKRLSDSMSISKKASKRLSLHPNTKLTGSASLGEQSNKSIENDETSAVPNDDSKPLNDVEIMDVDQSNNLTTSAPRTSQQQKVVIESSVEAIQAKCDAILQLANEAKREEKLKNKGMQDDKYQRLKEKKTAKLEEKKGKEARRLEREALAAKQRQLKREKKSKIAEVTEQEKSKAIEKALAFGQQILAKKNKHSSDATPTPLSQSIEEHHTTVTAVTTNKRKRKMLQILDEKPVEKKKKMKLSDDVQMPAKPEGFQINALPVKYNRNKNEKKNKAEIVRAIQHTTAGSFDVEPVPKKTTSPFTVTTLKYNPALKFSTIKDKAIFNSNVKRESAAELLNRKRKFKK